MLMPAAEISVMVCWMVRPVPAPPLAQKVLPMYCSIGAPLGLVGSPEGSCRPSRPNHDPARIGYTTPFFVMRPDVLTRQTAPATVPVGVGVVREVAVGVTRDVGVGVAVAVGVPRTTVVAVAVAVTVAVARALVAVAVAPPAHGVPPVSELANETVDE